MIKLCYLIPLTLCSLVMAQPGQRQAGDIQELRETLRFMRLAESKKNLNLPEDKLLAVNELFDAFEEKRFATRRQGRQLEKRIRQAKKSGEDTTGLIDDRLNLRMNDLKAEMALWASLKDSLSPTEAGETYIFYERFQRDVQRRIRSLQRDRRGGNQGKGQRNKNRQQ